MAASIIQKKAAFATVTGSGSVAVTLDNPVSAGTTLVIATGLVQTAGSSSARPSGILADDFDNNYDIGSYAASGQGFFANAYSTIALTPQEGAQTYTLNYTAASGESSSLFLAGLCVYELSGVSTIATNESASQGLGDGFHKMSELSATISGLSGGTFGNLLVSVGVFPFLSALSDAQSVAAGSGWSLDGRDAAMLGNSQPAAVVFESQFVDPSTNPAATFNGNGNKTEVDGVISVAAYSLTSASSGGGTGGGGSTPTVGTVFLGSVRVLSNAPAGARVPYLGTVKVVASPPTRATNPYLGSVVIGTAGPGNSNPSLGEVVVVDSVPSGNSDPFLGSVFEG